MVAAKARERKDSGMGEGSDPARESGDGLGPAEREEEREGRAQRGGGDRKTGLEAAVAPRSVHVGE